jgi:hypothetical protein
LEEDLPVVVSVKIIDTLRPSAGQGASIEVSIAQENSGAIRRMISTVNFICQSNGNAFQQRKAALFLLCKNCDGLRLSASAG